MCVPECDSSDGRSMKLETNTGEKMSCSSSTKIHLKFLSIFENVKQYQYITIFVKSFFAGWRCIKENNVLPKIMQ